MRVVGFKSPAFGEIVFEFRVSDNDLERAGKESAVKAQQLFYGCTGARVCDREVMVPLVLEFLVQLVKELGPPAPKN